VIFIWIGVVLLTGLGLGAGLLGPGVILLGAQAVRCHSNLELEWFWIIVGLLLIGWGFWELHGANLELARQTL